MKTTDERASEILASLKPALTRNLSHVEQADVLLVIRAAVRTDRREYLAALSAGWRQKLEEVSK